MIRVHFYKRLGILLFLLDVLALNGCYYVHIFHTVPPAHSREGWLILLALHFCWIAFFFFFKMNVIKRQLGVLSNMNNALRGMVFFAFLTLLIWNIASIELFSNRAFVRFLVYFLFANLASRMLLLYLIIYYRKRGYNLRRFVILGFSEEGRYIERYFSDNPGLGYAFKGYFDTKKNTPEIRGTLDDLPRYAQDENIHLIYACIAETDTQVLTQVTAFANQQLIKVYVVPKVMHFLDEGAHMQRCGQLPILDIFHNPLDDSLNRFTKRTFDIFFSLVVILFFLTWMVPLFAYLIRITSPGPIFFFQQRCGRRNQSFLCYKFRTLLQNTDPLARPVTRNDPRVTRIGHFLRRTSLDEMPQFINVLLGNMSVVGPRPHVPTINQLYSNHVDDFWLRHAVRPGITGLAQSKGYRGEIKTLHDIRGRVRLDKLYVKNWSLSLDIKVILSTLRALVKYTDKAY